MTSRRIGYGAAVTGVLVCVLVLLALGDARPADAADGEVRLVVTGFSGTVGPGANTETGSDLRFRVHVENTGTTELRDLRVAVEIFQAVTTRSALHLTLDENRPQTALLATEIISLAAGGRVDPGAIASTDVDIVADQVGWSDDGVYPIRITTLQGRDAIREVTTAVVYLSAVPETPLPTIVGWPLYADPAVDALGVRRLERQLGRDGRLDRLVRALEHHPDTGIQPLVSAHLIEDLAALSDVNPDAAALLERTIDELRRRGVAPVAPPYANADLAGLVAHGLPLEALRHVIEGSRRLEEAISRNVETDVLWSTGLVSPTAVRELLVPARIRTLLLSWSEVADPESMPDRTPSAMRRLATGGGSVTGVVGDPWLERLFEDLASPAGSVVAAQRILAETALIHFERPNADDRSLLLLPPALWNPPVGVADYLLAGIAAAPWLQTVSVTGPGLPRAQDAARLRVVTTGRIDAALVSEIRAIRRELSAIADALVLPTDELGGRTWVDLDTTILRAASRASDPGAQARAIGLLSGVREVLTIGLGTVTLPTDAQVTLTSVEGMIPVTVSRPEGPALRVRVELDAPPRLNLPDGASRELVLEEGDRTTISFRTTAQATGRIPVTVRVVLAPNGERDALVLAEETLVVRSTAVSRPALAILGVVLGILAAASWFRRRRPADPDLALVHDDAA